MNRALYSVALLLAVTALAAALVLRDGPNTVPNASGNRATTFEDELRDELSKVRGEVRELHESVIELNRSMAAFSASAGGLHAASGNGGPLPAGSAVSPAQIVELTEAVNQLRSGMVRTGLLPPASNEVSVLTAVVLNPRATPQEKLVALRTLRMANARSDDVVRQMIQAYYALDDAALQADIFRQLDGVTTPELKAPLLEAVSKASSAVVREEAAETLFHYLPDPNVRAWLEHLSAQDPDERVRRQATESLQRYTTGQGG